MPRHAVARFRVVCHHRAITASRLPTAPRLDPFPDRPIPRSAWSFRHVIRSQRRRAARPPAETPWDVVLPQSSTAHSGFDQRISPGYARTLQRTTGNHGGAYSSHWHPTEEREEWTTIK